MLILKSLLFSTFSFFLLVLFLSILPNVKAFSEEDISAGVGPVVKSDQRRSLVATGYGEISAIDIHDGYKGPYHLQFFTLEPNSLFLPVLLHADMIFYVQTGSGRLSWADGEDIVRVELQQGDIYMVRAGSVFHLHSSLEPERQKLRITAIFANTDDDLYEPSIGAYSSIADLVRSFDKKVLQAAFKAPEELIKEITSGTKSPAIVHAVSKEEPTFWQFEARFLKALLGSEGQMVSNKKKTRTFNILHADPDFENCNGRSVTVTNKKWKLLKGSNIGLFMVNLTRGAMMGPHWNPMASEIAIVLQGEGMVRVVCSSNSKKQECRNMRFKVQQGDVFAVPRFHPMAQMSYNSDSLVFVGFSTTSRKNHPQILAGKSSVLQTLDKQVLAMSFNVSNTTIDQLLASQDDSVIFECISCAEEEERKMQEEIEREKEEEEARKREEEEAKRREEEERKREQEEEEARRREEEEARRREEEERKREQEEEARKRKEEEARSREEEERKREQEEEARREEEAAGEREKERKRQEEEKRREEEEAQREQEDARRQEEEREEKRRQEEEAAREREKERKRQEEEKRREEEEEAQREQEEARRQQKEREEKRQEEEAARERERESKRQEEEKRREEEEEAQREQEEDSGDNKKERKEKRRQEEERRREEEEAAAEREQEEGRRQQKERERKRTQEEEKRGEGQQEEKRGEEEERRQREAEQEQEEARRQQEERQRKREKEEEQARQEGQGQEPDERIRRAEYYNRAKE
ncbi:Vicilin-like seed storage protein [Quillaja saponaria]|uniref:Vicilin-like seed storage protein n=1 Tax=Quillaja saponaria TaxID=32244 RepID=A0AAD7L854_QUISA|nr:Vicilin-like seed storage protein [Quillaja saponaria]